MRLYVPHTRLGEATRVVLAGYPRAICIDVSDDDGAYQDYLQARWDDGETFINLEHDVVPWPGAIEELQNCRGGWCVFGYTPDYDCLHGTAPLGLVKFSRDFIAALPHVWKVMGEQIGRTWGGCDSSLFRYATEHGLYPHQHFPAVLNANPKLINQ